MVRRRDRDPAGEGKLHLASVLDMGSRRVLGFALSEHHDAQLAYGALAMAVAVRGGQVPGVILHTDQGSEYTARAFRAADREAHCWFWVAAPGGMG
jgi:putative transposase